MVFDTAETVLSSILFQMLTTRAVIISWPTFVAYLSLQQSYIKYSTRRSVPVPLL